MNLKNIFLLMAIMTGAVAGKCGDDKAPVGESKSDSEPASDSEEDGGKPATE